MKTILKSVSVHVFFVKEALKFLNTTKLFKGVELSILTKKNYRSFLQNFFTYDHHVKWCTKFFCLLPNCLEFCQLFANTFFLVENKKKNMQFLFKGGPFNHVCMFFSQFLSNLFVEVCQDFPSMAFLSKVSENHF